MNIGTRLIYIIIGYFFLSINSKSQNLGYTPPAEGAYIFSGSVWSPYTSAAAFGAIGYTPPAIGLYCQASAGSAWTPCTPGGGGGGTITGITTTSPLSGSGTSGSVALSCPDCVILNPSTDQTITQPSGTALNVAGNLNSTGLVHFSNGSQSLFDGGWITSNAADDDVYGGLRIRSGGQIALVENSFMQVSSGSSEVFANGSTEQFQSGSFLVGLVGSSVNFGASGLQNCGPISVGTSSACPTTQSLLLSTNGGEIVQEDTTAAANSRLWYSLILGGIMHFGAETDGGTGSDWMAVTASGGVPSLAAFKVPASSPQIIATGSTPTMVAGLAAGTSPNCTTITGANMAGVITCTTGTATTASGTLATITFNGTIATAPQGCYLMPRNAAAASGSTTVYTTAPTTTTWTIAIGNLALNASTGYSWSYNCI